MQYYCQDLLNLREQSGNHRFPINQNWFQPNLLHRPMRFRGQTMRRLENYIVFKIFSKIRKLFKKLWTTLEESINFRMCLKYSRYYAMFEKFALWSRTFNLKIFQESFNWKFSKMKQNSKKFQNFLECSRMFLIVLELF